MERGRPGPRSHTRRVHGTDANRTALSPGFFPRASLVLRRRPGPLERVVEPGAHALERQPLLGERVAVAHGDRAVLARDVVDRERPWRADLVLPAGAGSDVAAVVVLDQMVPAELLVQLARRLDHSGRVLRDQRQD